MRLRTKLLLWWTGVVLLLVAGVLAPVLGIIDRSFQRVADSNFTGMRLSVHTLQTERMKRLRDAGAMVMSIPELRALIAEDNYEISAENLSSLQERLDTYVKILGVEFACVLDDRGRLIAQNGTSPWPKLKNLADYFEHEPEGPALIRKIFNPSSSRASTQTGIWVYAGKAYQVVGLPLVFGDGQEGDEAPSGALILATPWTDQLAMELGLSHNCDVAFLSRDSILACSLSGGARDELLKDYLGGKWPIEQAFSVRLAGAQYRASLDPLMDLSSGRQVGAILILSSENEAVAIRAAVVRNTIIIAMCGLLVAAVVSFLMSGAITRPVSDLVGGVRRVAAGDLESSIPIKRGDELGELAAAFNDMVVQLRTQRELQRLVEESQAASKAKSQFLANMSHELRTPLHGMLGITNLLLDTELSEQQRHYTHMVKRSTEVLATLINDILDFSKIEAGKLELENVQFNLHSTTQDVVELLSAKARAKSVQIISEIAPDVPCSAVGDPIRIRQVLLNLVGNAIKFTDQGKIVVRVMKQTEIAGVLSIRCEVTDTGIGIPAERMDRLFQSFSQVDASTTRRYGGTGLGLAISRQLVELMGGEIGVTSQVGKGSTFWFTLKLRESDGSAEVSEAKGGDQATTEPAPKNNFRILVAEDNEINQIVARDFLTKAGFETTVVPNGRNAVDAIINGQFDLILMDCQMPVMDGFEATRAIRNHEKDRALGKPVPIIALTANASGADRERCKDAGMDGYCGKPFKPRELLDTVWSFLSDNAKNTGGLPGELSAPPAASQKFDIDSLIARCSGNSTLAVSILEKFEKQTASLVADIEKSIASGDADRTAKLSHTLKGSAGMVGADSIRAVAAELEQLGRRSELEAASQTLGSLRDAVEKCVSELPAVRHELSTTAKRA
jgi:signal transduction histidine kinase/DNA-binding response OmpR family regulator